jgi:epoxyqueuosine reductase
MTQISTTELKARLVSFAREVGFDSCRVAACNAPAHANDFREWLRDGAHGEMNYMQRGEEKRCDPEQVLSGARSIVVLALNYFQGDPARRTALQQEQARSRDTLGAKIITT